MIASTTARPSVRTAKLKLDEPTFDRSMVAEPYRHLDADLLQWLHDARGRRTLGRA
jgi:hypothetical protein